jgi:hypothetical protein
MAGTRIAGAQTLAGGKTAIPIVAITAMACFEAGCSIRNRRTASRAAPPRSSGRTRDAAPQPENGAVRTIPAPPGVSLNVCSARLRRRLPDFARGVRSRTAFETLINHQHTE